MHACGWQAVRSELQPWPKLPSAPHLPPPASGLQRCFNGAKLKERNCREGAALLSQPFGWIRAGSPVSPDFLISPN